MRAVAKRNLPTWRGEGRTLENPATWTAERDFWFGGRRVPKGSEVKQFETRNFGWTAWTEPSGVKHLARE